MIKYISNIADSALSSNISIETKAVGVNGGAYSFYNPEIIDGRGPFYSLNSSKELFVKVKINNINSTDCISKLLFNLIIVCSPINVGIRVYRLNELITNFGDSAAQLHSKLTKTNSYIVDQVAVPSIINYAASSNIHQTLTLDITRIVKYYNQANPEFIFAIVFDNVISSVNIYDPAFASAQNGEVSSAIVTRNVGVNNLCEYENLSFSNFDNVYINTKNGHLISNFSSFKTLSNNMPLSFLLAHNGHSSNTSCNLPYYLKASFEYDIYDENGYIIIKDCNGTQFAYKKVPSSINDYQLEMLGIKHVDGLNRNSLYYCIENGTYFFKTIANESSGQIVIEQYDTNDNYIKYCIDNGLTKITKQRNRMGDEITYSWSQISPNVCKLVSISNTSGDQITITYNNSNQFYEVIFVNEEKKIIFNYDDNNYKVTYKLYDIHNNVNELLGVMELVFWSNNLYKIIEKDSSELIKRQVHFTYQHDKIRSIFAYDKDDNIVYRADYTFLDNYSIIEAGNETLKYYFDEYGRTILKVDNFGNCKTVNYGEIDDSLLKGALSVSDFIPWSRNIINNHSFEYLDNNQDLLAWTKTGSGTFELSNDALFGEKCLLIRTTDTQTLHLKQELGKLAQGSYILKCRAKGSSDDIVRIRIEKYNINNPYSSQSFDVNLSFVTDEWESYNCSVNIPQLSESEYVRIDIYSSGNSVCFIDDLQFGVKNQVTRYNLITNSCLDRQTITSGLPDCWEFENLSSEDGLISQYDDEFTPLFGNYSMAFKNINNELDGSRYESRKMFQTINYSGTKNDVFSFGVFARGLATLNDIFRAYIIFDYDDVGPKVYYFDFVKGIESHQLLARDIRPEADYSAITIGVEYNGTHIIRFNGFELCKDASIRYYNYDKRANILDSSDAYGNFYKLTFNDNLLTLLTKEDGSTFKYSYLSDGKIKSVEDMFANKMILTYDNQDSSNNIVSIKLQCGNEIIENEFSYDSSDNLISKTDEFLNQTSYTYDYLKRVKAINYANGSVKKFNYDSLNNLIELSYFNNCSVLNPSFKNNIAYNETIDSVNAISSLSGKQYSFNHDSNARLLSISENNIAVCSFSYDLYIDNIQTDLVTSKEYVASGDVFLFEYDEQKRLNKIYLNDYNNLLFEYKYNDFGNVNEIKDYQNNKCKYYSYDLKGNLIKVTDKELTIEYQYDNLGNVQIKKSKINDQTIIQSYDYDYEFNDYSKLGLINKMASNYGDDIVISDNLGNGEYGLIYTNKHLAYHYDNSMKSSLFDFADKRDYILYDLNTININRTSGKSSGKYFNLSVWQSRYKFTKTFYMMFKPRGTIGSKTNLLKLYNKQNSSPAISSVDIDSSGHIIYTSINAYSPSLSISSGIVSLNNWNTLVLSIYYDKLNNSSKAQMILLNNNGRFYANPHTISEQPYNIDAAGISIQDLDYSPHDDSSSSEEEQEYVMSMPFYIATLGFSNFLFSENISQDLHDAWIKYYANSYMVNDVSSSNMSVDGTDFDVITLNGNLESIKGIKPLNNISSIVSYDTQKETCFSYDDGKMRKVFSCFSDDSFSPLAYNISCGMSGTISLWFKKDGVNQRDRFILSIYQDSTLKLGVFFNSTTLYLRFGNSNVPYVNLVVDELWHNIRFEWSQGYMSFKFDGDSKTVINFPFLGDNIIYIGTLGHNKTYALNGFIESIVVSSDYHAYSVDDIKRTRPSVVGYKFDELHRLNTKSWITGEDSFDTLYTYNKTHITKEQFYNDGEITYAYDSMENITSITSNNRQDQYLYDALGRLTYHNHNNGSYDESFHYNSNGDITCRDVDGIDMEYEYSYDSLKRLTSITLDNENYRVLSYPNNDFYPSSISFYNGGSLRKMASLSWQGRRLVCANINGNNNIAYGYNEAGVMVYKNTSNDNTKFILEGSNIISLTKQSLTSAYSPITFDFIYDSYNMLSQIKYNNKIYYYVRDILGNIYGIINSSGNYIVKYNYTAFGEISKQILVSSGDDKVVAINNPFMFKGYYYDDELECYYLKSRFYMPSICRFISPDDHSYLDYEDVRGLNLYAYCYNNPVMYCDGSGHFPILACILGITALVGMGLTIGGVASDNNVLKSIGLTMVAVPALISGGIAIAAGIAGAALTGIVGGVTVAAGLGTATFASAEYQQMITGNNWMLDAGMSKDWYNGLMIATASIATFGTFASSFCSSFNIKSIQELGKFGDYRGMRFTTGDGKERVLSFHTHGHKVAHGFKSISEWHWQLQKWNPYTGKTAGTIARWIWWNLM